MNIRDTMRLQLEGKLPLLNAPSSVIENDWYYDPEVNIYKGLHVTELILLESNYAPLPTGYRLMCGGCLQHFEIKQLQRVRVEYYYEQSGGLIYKDDRHVCKVCYQMSVYLLEQELPDCKEPDPEE